MRNATMGIAEREADGSIRLPEAIASRLSPNERLMVIMSGDTILLKRFHHARVTEIAARAPSDDRMTAEEVDEIIRRHRREKRAAAWTADQRGMRRTP